MVYLVIRNSLVCEYALVYEGLQVCRLYAKSLQNTERLIVFLADNPQEQMVRADAITARTHSLFTCVFDDKIKIVRNL